MSIFANLSDRLKSFLVKKSPVQQIKELTPQEQTAFNSLPVLDQANLIIADSRGLNNAAQIAALLDLGHEKEARDIQKSFSSNSTSNATLSTETALSKKKLAGSLAQSITPLEEPVQLAHARVAAVGLQKQESNQQGEPKQAIATEPTLTGIAKARSLFSKQAVNIKQNCAKTEQEKKRSAARDELNRMSIEFGQLQGSAAKRAYWFMNRDKINGLVKIECIRGQKWIKGFLQWD